MCTYMMIAENRTPWLHDFDIIILCSADGSAVVRAWAGTGNHVRNPIEYFALLKTGGRTP